MISITNKSSKFELVQFIYKDRNFNSIHCLNTRKKELYNGLYLYTAEIQGDCYDARNVLLENSYQALIFSLIPKNYETPNIQNLKEILTQLILKLTNLNPDQININVEPDQSITFTPMIKINDVLMNLYVHPRDPILNLVISDFIGLKFISTNLLTMYAYKEIKGIDGKCTSSKLFNLNGVFCLDQSQKKLIDDLNLRLIALEDSGVIYSEVNLDQLTLLWPITKKDENVYKVSEDVDQDWIQESLIHINTDSLPNYTITGSWQLLGGERVKLNFKAVKAYLELVKSNPILLVEITKLKVNLDLSITGKFGSWNEVQKFKKFFDSDISDLSIFGYKTIKEAFTARRLVEQANGMVDTYIIFSDEIYWMIVTQSDFSLPEISIDELSMDDYSIDDLSVEAIIGAVSTDVTRGLLDQNDILSIILPGNVEITNKKIYIIYQDNSLFLSDYDDFNIPLEELNQLWQNGDFLSEYGVTKFVNQVPINQSDLKLI